jgi:hypothetical protein
MLLRVVDGETFRDIHIKEGEMFLIPRPCAVPMVFSNWTCFDLVCSSQHASQSCSICWHYRSRHWEEASGWLYWCATHADDLKPHPVLNKIIFIEDRLRWYCSDKSHEKPTIIREEAFHVTDLGSQLKPLIQNWIQNEQVRKCSVCGSTAPPKW